ncbi:hypothetical protein HOA93_02730 [bacterium]|nr:hypothetical protein [bacterium]MBT6778689.1 hypothetical protein [bacterium]
MAFVLFVIFSSILSISIFHVSFSTSTKTGVAQVCSIEFAVEINDNGVVITSSHSHILKYFRDKNNAAVHDLSHIEYLFQLNLESLSSNSATTSQVDKNREFNTVVKFSISLVSILCL